MECNKEEAIRAKGIAAKKMESKDFAGAHKIATKAQHLYPDLENISQMICVCEVHCSAENKMFGNEMDWYGVLQVNQTADDALIKKQYRKLALLLHPDKNKFAGAEAAFKLIGEAQRMLLDKEKRSFYDLKRKTTTSRPMAASNRPPQGNRNSTTVKQPWARNSFASNTGSYVKGFSSSSQSPYQQAQSAVPNGKETFWTLCPFCAVRYQYYKDVLNRALRCQACNKPFIAYDMCAQGMPPGSSANQTAKYSRAEAHSQSHCSLNNNRFPGNLGPQKPKMDSFAKTETQKAKMDSFAKTENNTEVQGLQKTNALPKVAKRAKAKVSEGSNSSRKANGKRGKKRVSESSESFQSESSTDGGCAEVEVEALAAQDLKVEGENNRRRSTRSKRHVSYNENGSDEEDMQGPAKRPKVYGSSSFTGVETIDASSEEELGERTEPPGLDEKVDKIREKVYGNASLVKESQSNSFRVTHDSAANSSAEASETVLQEYPDPDFSDFDQVRNEDCFKVGQIWAAYDTLDAMPRFYAQIRKVFSPGFKLRITWLEADHVGENEVRWVSKELPVSCGRYKHGDSENTKNRLMFSHPISWEKGTGKGAIKIYPKKEETWALFKDWHLGWICDPDNSRKYEYEFVEVLSDYDATLGIRVAFLIKLKGFASLFCRQSGDELQIPPSELLRFSHRVLSFKMTGRERDDVPGGSFELDPACISTDLEEIPVPPEMTAGAEDHISNGSSSESVEVNPDTKVQSKASSSQNDQVNAEHHNSYVDIDDLATTQEFCPEEADEIPEPEFFDFVAAKALGKFQTGQVWALYSDADGLPKYYAQIKKIDPHSDIKLQILWLEPCSLPCDLTMWKDKEMPISCGIFKIKSLKSQWYFDSSPFSHQVFVQTTSKRNVFEIYPREGEIWALYKNWNAKMTVSELVSCEYDIVEVQERNVDHLFTSVSVLEQVSGFNSVFKSRSENSSFVSMEVPHSELLRFSHQIPSHKLTDEKGSSLRGCWELDPNALPSSFFCKS